MKVYAKVIVVKNGIEMAPLTYKSSKSDIIRYWNMINYLNRNSIPFYQIEV